MPGLARQARQPPATYPRLNLSLHLSERLLTLPARQRSLQTPAIVAEMLRGTDRVWLDHIELLFDPALRVDPLRLLRSASRQRLLVVTWPGRYDPSTGTLTYAEPGHPEYRHYHPADLAGVSIADTAAPPGEE